MSYQPIQKNTKFRSLEIVTILRVNLTLNVRTVPNAHLRGLKTAPSMPRPSSEAQLYPILKLSSCKLCF